VDRHCTRLDNDLQKIEDEQLIGPGRTCPTPISARKRPREMEDNSTGSISTQEHPIIKKQGISHRKSKKKLQSILTDESAGRKGTKKNAPKTIRPAEEEKSYLSTEDAIQQAKAYV
jgi:hypothetical protein